MGDLELDIDQFVGGDLRNDKLSHLASDAVNQDSRCGTPAGPVKSTELTTVEGRSSFKTDVAARTGKSEGDIARTAARSEAAAFPGKTCHRPKDHLSIALGLGLSPARVPENSLGNERHRGGQKGNGADDDRNQELEQCETSLMVHELHGVRSVLK